MSADHPHEAASGQRSIPEAAPAGRFRAFLARSGLLLALIILFVVLAAVAPNFLSARNLLNVLRQVSFVGIIACGMTMALIGAEVDLSVGSVVALTCCLLGVLNQKLGWPLGLAIAAVIVESTLMGVFAGWIRVKWDIPGLIVTIALMLSLRGLAYVVTNAFPIPITNDSFAFLGSGDVLGVPFPAILFLLTMALFGFISTRTVYGRSVYAVGGNAEATRLSGIPINRIRILLFATTGLLAAVSGILLTSRLSSANAGVAVGWEFDVISAVIIGGTSLFGGEGSMFGTLLGVLFIGLLGNGMVMLGVNPYYQQVARGVIILLAVLLSALQRPKTTA
ncbi:MAG TPA: ABC transporter permease [Spirochaetia bacterium]|nr:ABC transporter permease [Spirochaetia bacterium]